MPTYSDLRRGIAALMLDRHEWAGCPVPIEGLRLHLEPSYPYQGIADCMADEPTDDSGLDANGLLPGETFVNSWYSRVRETHVYVIRGADGRTVAFTLPEKRYNRRLSIDIESIKASWAHDLTAEGTAMEALSQHLSEYQLQQYFLLGYFLETSKRSGVSYIFRRIRPTLALRPAHGHMRVIAALCLHPIGYYRETFVGAMTPTDDVIAHLLMMRGDEPMFWRRSNQHSPEHAEACL